MAALGLERVTLATVGDDGVGKASIVERYLFDAFSPSPRGIRHCQHTDCQHVNVNGTEVTLTVKNDLLGDMDDPSHDRHPLFYATDGILLVYDITDEESFSNMEMWWEKINRCTPHRYTLPHRAMLIGNKEDCNKERQVQKERGIQFAKEFGMDFINMDTSEMKFMETSAKTGHNIRKAFNTLIEDIVNSREFAADDGLVSPVMPSISSEEQDTEVQANSSEDSKISAKESIKLQSKMKAKEDEFKRQLQKKDKELEKFKGELKKFQGEAKKAKEEEFQRKLQKKDRELEKFKGEVKKFQGEAKNFQEEVNQLQQDICAKDEVIAAKENEIQEKADQIADLQERALSLSIDHSTQVQSLTGTWKVPRAEIRRIAKREIGRGAWGVVYSGTFRGECVAIKQAHKEVLHHTTIEMLKREVMIMADLQHPNLVRFIAAVFDEAVERGADMPIIVSELMDTNLRAAYREHNLSNSLLSIFRDVAYAIHYLHHNRQPIIHRDLSAPNVLLKVLQNGAYQAKVSDFGSANLLKKARTAGSGAIVYSAPEMFPSEDITAPPRPQTTKVDVFSYGILLLEVIVKEIPTPELRHTMLQRVSRQWKLMHELIVHCTKPLPSDRPTMADILNKLNKVP